MNIALIADDGKKELMVQFCIAYCGILAKHDLSSTFTTGRLISEATGLKVRTYLHSAQGCQQLDARISYNEIDLVLFFCDAESGHFDEVNRMARLCDQRQIPFASNVATAEVLILGLSRGDLDWRDIVNPKKEIVSPKGIIITMDKIKPRTLSGFMELPPDKQVQMDKMRAVLAETYARYGFTPLDTPAIEAAEVLLAKGGGETEKQIYRFTKGDSDLALRFDLTVPLAKYVAANYGQLTFPFRRYQIGKVWRGERAQRGRFREFYQADIDIIGDGALDILNEAEIPAIIYDTFTRLGLHRFRIRVNNRKVLNGFFAILGLSEQAGDVLRTIDKLDKIGADKVRELLTDTCGVTGENADEILRFIACPARARISSPFSSSTAAGTRHSIPASTNCAPSWATCPRSASRRRTSSSTSRSRAASITTPARCTRPSCSTIPRSAASAPAGATTTSRGTIRTSPCPASASPSA